MARPNYKFSEFVDLLLVRLYELDQTENGGSFFDLNAIARDIRGDVPAEWVFDAAKVLDTRALADCLFTFGSTSAKISGEGRLYVEEGRGTTKRVQESPATFYVSVAGNNNQVVAGHNANEVRQTVATEHSPIMLVIDEIVSRLKADQALSATNRDEAIDYAELIRREIKKPEPNRALLSAVLEPLSKIASIAGNVASLIKLFNVAS